MSDTVTEPRHLLPTQGNAVLRAIQRAGLDPTEFEWREVVLDAPEDFIGTGPVIDVLVYLPSETDGSPPGTFFMFGRDRVIYSPGDEQLRDERRAKDWDQTLLHLIRWLENIKRESGPSLWELLARAELPAAGPNAGAHFTPQELVAIREQLKVMAQRVEALDALTRRQKDEVAEELRRIGDAAPRMSRGEWFRFAIGSLITLLLSSDLQKSVAASLMQWGVAAFHSLATGTPLPPLLPPR
jgi:hypothetical protein